MSDAAISRQMAISRRLALCMSSSGSFGLPLCWDADETSSLQMSTQGREEQQAVLLAMEEVQQIMQ